MMQAGMPRPSGVAGITLVQTAAMIIPFVFILRGDPIAYAALFGVALFSALVWEALFAYLRKRPFSVHGVTTAIIFSTLAPVELGLWHVVVTVSLGVTYGELVFGGRGFGFLNPAAVALVLLVISFPQVALQPPSRELALTTMPGAMLLMAFGFVSWRVILGVAVGVLAALAIGGQSVDPAAIAIGLAFGVFFLICDPISAAATNVGRWIYGALAGALVVLFSPDGAIAIEAVVFAALVASIFAPLIDHLVVLAHARRRRGRIHA